MFSLYVKRVVVVNAHEYKSRNRNSENNTPFGFKFGPITTLLRMHYLRKNRRICVLNVYVCVLVPC
jgi:hypothetical protein